MVYQTNPPYRKYYFLGQFVLFWNFFHMSQDSCVSDEENDLSRLRTMNMTSNSVIWDFKKLELSEFRFKISMAFFWTFFIIMKITLKTSQRWRIQSPYKFLSFAFLSLYPLRKNEQTVSIMMVHITALKSWSNYLYKWNKSNA